MPLLVAAGIAAAAAVQFWRSRRTPGARPAPQRLPVASGAHRLAGPMTQAALAAALAVAMGIHPYGALKVGARQLGRGLAAQRSRR
jgi:hypothetical protein